MTNLRSTLRAIVRDAAKLNRSGVEVRYALRCTAGVALPLIVATLSGSALAGASAAYGALVAGLASRQGVYRSRAIGMLLTSLALAVSGFAGASTGAFPVVNLVLAGVWAAAFGLVAAMGRSATVTSVNAIVAFVVFSNPPYDGSIPWFQGAMIFAGGVLQTLLLVLVWPLQRFRTEHRVLANAYRSLARYADHVSVDDLGLPETASLVEVRATLADPQPFGNRNELGALEALADEAERLRTFLAALTSDYHLLAEVGLLPAAAAIGRVAASTSVILDALGDAIGRGVEPALDRPRWDDLDAAVRDVEANAAAGAPAVGDARKLSGAVRAAWRAGRAAANGGVAAAEAQPAVWFELATIADAIDTLRANVSLDSIYARHALRLAITITLAIVIQRIIPLAHAQWIGLTVAIVLRPEFSTTFTRGLARIGGTVGGAVIASAIAALHPPEGGYVTLSILFAGVAYALFNVSYALFSTAITGYVIYLQAFGGAPEHAAAIDRVAATIAGGLLALIAYAAWPTWASARVGEELAALIAAQRAYAIGILRTFLAARPLAIEALRAEQLASRRARSNAEVSVDQMKGEPVQRGRGISLAAAQGVLAASRRIGVASLTLSARLGERDDRSRALLVTLIADLDIAMERVVDALRSGQAPDALPPLRDDQTMLARAVAAEPDAHWEILASETDLIVDSVNTIADLLRRP